MRLVLWETCTFGLIGVSKSEISVELTVEDGLFLEGFVECLGSTLTEDGLAQLCEKSGYTTPLTRHCCPPILRELGVNSKEFTPTYPNSSEFTCKLNFF